MKATLLFSTVLTVFAALGLVSAQATESNEDHWVLLLGLTGSGKSTFIQHATGDDNVKVCHEPFACTTDPGYWTAYLPLTNGQTATFNLIDTPGFNDPSLDDTQVLRRVSEYLASLGRLDIFPKAVLYLHPATATKFDRSDMRSLAVLKELAGTDFYANVLLVTTMWEETNEVKAAWRIDQLVRDEAIWGDMVGAGAKVVRFDNSRESAWDILWHHVARLGDDAGRQQLQVQRQMVGSGLPFEQTWAYLSINTFDFVDELVRLYTSGQLSAKTVVNAVGIWLRQAAGGPGPARGVEFYVRMFNLAWYGIKKQVRGNIYTMAMTAIFAYFGMVYTPQVAEPFKFFGVPLNFWDRDDGGDL